MIDILIEGGCVVTIDAKRRVLQDGSVAVDQGRIIEVGPSDHLRSKYQARRSISAVRKVLLPGFIDTHAHAGHGLTKTIGEHAYRGWFLLMDHIYFRSTTEEFWHAEAQLSGLEKLKFGTTCAVSMLGSAPRCDDPAFSDAHFEGVRDIGIRDILGMGPPRGPWPIAFSTWKGFQRTDRRVTLEDCFKTTERVIQKWHSADGKFQVCVAASSFAPSGYDRVIVGVNDGVARNQSQFLRELAARYDVALHGHCYAGAIDFMRQHLGILGPKTQLAHCVGISPEEVKILADTGTKAIHCPNARGHTQGRCPVPELLEAGVNVAVASDATSPDRTFDLLKDIKTAMTLHRTHFRDVKVLPPGKMLELITIDAARVLGLENEIGSLEMGKKADIILIDLDKPHLTPAFMPVHRIVYEATGADVDTVMVEGEILMENRQVKHVDEKKILRNAEREAELMVKRSGVKPFMGMPRKFWGHARY
jgi:5-methylthioadenosine/S-adenosylhomocysteine deaminase